MKLGFIKTDFPFEKRIPLLPEDVYEFENEIYIERTFGETLGITDEDYQLKGCQIATKEEIFAQCDAIFTLKRISESDYSLLRDNQFIIGWIHPKGSGKTFMKEQAVAKNLMVFDLDNRYPTIYYQGKEIKPADVPSNFIYQNSFYAGYASVLHGLLSFGLFPTDQTKVAILGSGNVSQGAMQAITKFTSNVRLFYRKTMSEFKRDIASFDIIVNGIEVGDDGASILTTTDQENLKSGAFIIDAAADAGNAVSGDHFTTVAEPIYQSGDHFYYCVANAPALFFRSASKMLSKQFSHYIFKQDLKNLVTEVKKTCEGGKLR